MCSLVLEEEEGREKRGAIGLIRTIPERRRGKEKGIGLCFTEMEKTFDRVKWDKLIETIKEKRGEWKTEVVALPT